ncbi:MAG TPA: hypothetical protein VHB99_11235, partial [Pirellulales bacterium]|nr:hypothetical protein [Pirellulales bacterium]
DSVKGIKRPVLAGGIGKVVMIERGGPRPPRLSPNFWPAPPIYAKSSLSAAGSGFKIIVAPDRRDKAAGVGGPILVSL